MSLTKSNKSKEGEGVFFSLDPARKVKSKILIRISTHNLIRNIKIFPLDFLWKFKVKIRDVLPEKNFY